MRRVLIDQNISHSIMAYLRVPDMEWRHVKDVGLMNTDDRLIFQWAKQNHIDLILTLDNGFRNIVFGLGAPPQVIHCKARNFRTRKLAEFLLARIDLVLDFANKGKDTLLSLE